MTSCERVLKALDHEEPARVRLDLGRSFVASIAANETAREVRRYPIQPG